MGRVIRTFADAILTALLGVGFWIVAAAMADTLPRFAFYMGLGGLLAVGYGAVRVLWGFVLIPLVAGKYVLSETDGSHEEGVGTSPMTTTEDGLGSGETVGGDSRFDQTTDGDGERGERAGDDETEELALDPTDDDVIDVTRLYTARKGVIRLDCTGTCSEPTMPVRKRDDPRSVIRCSVCGKRHSEDSLIAVNE